MAKSLTQEQINQIKELNKLGLSSRKISNQVGCSRGVVMYYRDPEKYKAVKSENTERHKIGKRLDKQTIELIYKLRDDGESQKSIALLLGINQCTVARYVTRSVYEKNLAAKRKKYHSGEKSPTTLKKERGSKCEICGFDKHLACLDFHHKDPRQKKFGIAKGNGYSIDAVREEASKCILVCKNCHALIHAGIIQIPLDSH